MKVSDISCACAILILSIKPLIAGTPSSVPAQNFEVFYSGWNEGRLSFRIPTNPKESVNVEFESPDRKKLTMLRLKLSVDQTINLTPLVSHIPMAFPNRISLVFHKWEGDRMSRSLSVILPFQIDATPVRRTTCQAMWFLVTGDQIEEKTIEVPNERCAY